MEGFKKGLYTTSSKKEKKQEIISGSLLSFNLNSFLNNISNLEYIRTMKNEVDSEKNYMLTSIQEEKPRKQAKSVLYQEVSKFNPSGQRSMEQLNKVVLNLQEEVKKLRKKQREANAITQPSRKNRVKTHVLGRSKRLLKYITSQSSQSQSQLQKQTELDNRLGKIEEKLLTFKKEQSKTGAIQMEIEAQKEQTQQGKQLKIKKKCFCCGSVEIFIESVGNFYRNKETIGQRTTTTKKSKNEKNVLQPGWFNIQDQDGTISSKRKENLEKSEFSISLKLDYPNIYIQMQ